MGSSGLLGSAIVERLQNAYPEIRTCGFDIVETDDVAVEFQKGDVTDPASIDATLDRFGDIDTVINTVSIVDFNPKNDARMDHVNVDGATNVLKACEDHGVRRLVHTSSMDVVYEGKPIADGDESLPYSSHFLDHYSLTKKLAEERVLGATSPVAKCALRATGLFGPRDNVRFPALVKSVMEGKYARIGGADTKYSHVFSQNCAHAHVLAALTLEPGGPLDGKAYFIVDEAKMALTNNGVFSHCLPLRRNVKATDGVMDSPQCIAVDEAENRLHVQKAIMAALVNQ